MTGSKSTYNDLQWNWSSRNSGSLILPPTLNFRWGIDAVVRLQGDVL